MTPPVKHGLFYGIAGIVLSFILYSIDHSMLYKGALANFLPIALAILFIILSIREDRGNESGYTFADGLKAGIITFAIGSLLYNVFIFILTNYIDPSLVEEAIAYSKELGLKTAEAVSGIFGADVDKEAMEKAMAEQTIPNPFSITSLGLAWVIGLIFPGAIISLIAAAIMKRN